MEERMKLEEVMTWTIGAKNAKTLWMIYGFIFPKVLWKMCRIVFLNLMTPSQ